MIQFLLVDMVHVRHGVGGSITAGFLLLFAMHVRILLTVPWRSCGGVGRGVWTGAPRAARPRCKISYAAHKHWIALPCVYTYCRILPYCLNLNKQRLSSRIQWSLILYCALNWRWTSRLWWSVALSKPKISYAFEKNSSLECPKHEAVRGL